MYKRQAIARRGGDVWGAKSAVANIGIDVVKSGAFLRPLDRSMEYEADRLGVVIAARSGYDPYGLVAVLQMLAQLKGDGSGAAIFDTHPPAADRIAELEKFMPKALGNLPNLPQLEARYRQTVK